MIMTREQEILDMYNNSIKNKHDRKNLIGQLKKEIDRFIENPSIDKVQNLKDLNKEIEIL